MATATVLRPEPVRPPATITLELDETEAQYLLCALILADPRSGLFTPNSPDHTFDPVYKALSRVLDDLGLDPELDDFVRVDGD